MMGIFKEKECCFTFNAGNSNETSHIPFWYVKHKNNIKFQMENLNTFLADIERTLFRHPNIFASELTFQPQYSAH